MDQQFWISAAIAAVDGWGPGFSRKGKVHIHLSEKYAGHFKGVCLNPKSRLTDEQCKKIAIGAMYSFSARSISKLDRNRYSRYASQNTWRMVEN